MRVRAQNRQPLTRPELSVLLAYAKIDLNEEILASDLPDDPRLQEELQRYFPVALQETYPAALQGHRLAGAAIDVFAVEPLPKDDPLWTAPRTLITPHIAGESDDYLQQVLPILHENLGLFLQGRTMDMRNLQARS